MNIFNFLFYHLTFWYEEHSYILKWSTPMERTSYALGLFTISVSYSIYIVLKYTLFTSESFVIPELVFVIEGLLAIWLFDLIYIKNGKCAKLSYSVVGKQKGAIISVAVLVVGIFSPILMVVIFIPFGGHKHTSH